MTKPTVPLPSEQPTLSIWPEAAEALGITSKAAAYRSAKAGFMPTIRIGQRRWVVPTAKLRAMLGLPEETL